MRSIYIGLLIVCALSTSAQNLPKNTYLIANGTSMTRIGNIVVFKTTDVRVFEAVRRKFRLKPSDYTTISIQSFTGSYLQYSFPIKKKEAYKVESFIKSNF